MSVAANEYSIELLEKRVAAVEAAIGFHKQPPEPKVIDWASVPVNTPVMFWDGAPYKNMYFFERYDSGCPSFPFRIRSTGYENASLETGIWVYNETGVNPWPEGVMVEYIMRLGDFAKAEPATDLIWGLARRSNDDIISSRAVGLQEGWVYE